MLLSRRHQQLDPLFLQDSKIEQVSSYKYLGVMITSNLKWDNHINIVSLKARRLLGYLYRVFYRNVEPKYLLNLYISLVRPHLEYACQIWDPYTQISIDQLEKVQKYALRICTGQWNAGYDDLLDQFNLPRLSNRREFLRLVTFFQIHTNHFYFPPHVLSHQLRAMSTTSTSNRRQVPAHAYTIPFARTTTFKQSFFPRTISVWNYLPELVIDNNICYFKTILRNFLL